MLQPDVLPQFTYQLYSNADYQVLEKAMAKTKTCKLDSDGESEHIGHTDNEDGDDETQEKKLVLKYNVENVEAIN